MTFLLWSMTWHLLPMSVLGLSLSPFGFLGVLNSAGGDGDCILWVSEQKHHGRARSWKHGGDSRAEEKVEVEGEEEKAAVWDSSLTYIDSVWSQPAPHRLSFKWEWENAISICGFCLTPVEVPSGLWLGVSPTFVKDTRPGESEDIGNLAYALGAWTLGRKGDDIKDTEGGMWGQGARSDSVWTELYWVSLFLCRGMFTQERGHDFQAWVHNPIASTGVHFDGELCAESRECNIYLESDFPE